MITRLLLAVALSVLCFPNRTHAEFFNDAQVQEPAVAPPKVQEIALPEVQGFTDAQVKYLSLAYLVAKELKIKPTVLQGILLVESNAGEDKKMNAGRSYFGLAQLKPVAAREALRLQPWLSERFNVTSTSNAALKQLLKEPTFNVYVAAVYYKLNVRHPDQAYKLAAYNQGASGVKRVQPSTFPYVLKVHRAMKDARVQLLNAELDRMVQDEVGA